MFYSSKVVRRTFASKVANNTLIKSQAYHVVVQFIPLTLRPERMSDLWEIEERNGIDEGDVI